jgi:GDPmannose 4,6-dehydratase
MFCAASHEMYGSARRVVDEHTPPAPETPHGIASAYAYATAARYRREFGMHIARGIMFEHVSPRCEPSSPLRSIARAIADLRRTGGGDVVIDMAATSDIGSAHDYVRAMHLALTHSVAGDYIISSGASQTLGDVALAMWRAAGIRSGRILDTGAGVPHGPIASPKKAMLVLGWQPRATLAAIAADLIETESAGAAPVTVASPARRRVSWAARPALEHEAEDTLADRARAA